MEIAALMHNLTLSHNCLTGTFPLRLKLLHWIDLSHNSISGEIPFTENLEHLDLSYNNFNGSGSPIWSICVTSTFVITKLLVKSLQI
jgi:hypothetical protein